ncbi:unnamed protein product [Pylaiella littoralis]
MHNADEELPPPPVSPPRLGSGRKGATTAAPPGYVSKSLREGEKFRQANLPRRIPDSTQPTNFRLARQGEKLANGDEPPLYDVWGSSYKAMDEFGIGVGLYYRQLLALGFVIILCVFVYITTMVHNASFNGSSTPTHLIGTAHNASREDLSLNKNGVPDLIVTLMLVLFALAARKLENVAVESIDTAQQTPQDYSVCIHSPPRAPGLSDPDTYRDKFCVHGEIVFITICLDNGSLLKTVAKKRVIEHQLHALHGKVELAKREGKEEDGAKLATQTTADLKGWQAWLQSKLGLFATKDYLEKSLKDTNERLKGLSQRHYDPKRVYITFQTEHAQRKCLKAVETGLWEEQVAKFRGKVPNPEAVIAGRVVRIDEAEEPSDVLWENIDTSIIHRMTTWALSGFLSAAFLTGSFFILSAVFTSGLIGAIFVALVNALLPLVIRVLTLAIEVHKSLTQMQASMMFKLVTARAINSAFLLFIITSDTEQLEEGTLTKILSILIADAFTGPLLRLTNVPDLIGRKLIAPKAKTQAEMNIFFQGAIWNLAERYTDMIKTVFVGLFYSAIVPTGLIVTAGAMMMLYWVDKYSLLRLWKRPPAYDARLSSYTRKYVILCIWLHLVMARIFFAEWPSKAREEIPDCNLLTCSFGDDENVFSEGQEQIVNIYEILGTLVFAAGGALVVLLYIRHYATKLVLTKHKAVGKASDIKYRTVSGIDAYVPLIYVRQLTDPLLGMDVNDLPRNAHPFLPLRVGGFYSAEELSMSSDRDFPDISKRERDELFSKVKYYPGPKEKLQRGAKNGGILYAATAPDQVPATAGIIDERFTLARQTSANGVAFVPPVGRVEESALPQRSRRNGSRVGIENPLPAGWEGRTTAQGQPYYVCNHTRTTQWERPTMAVLTSSRSFASLPDTGGSIPDIHGALKDLPPGWEVKYAPDGRPYYVDHNKHVTSWDHPQGPQWQAEQSRSVEQTQGGTELLEQFTNAGLRYYLNPRTKDVRWSPPKARGRGSSTVKRGGGGGGGMDESISTTSRWEGQASGLPRGWEARTTPAGRVYYVNHEKRITQWDRPPPSSAGEYKSSYSDQAAAPAPAGGVPSAPAVGAPGGFGIAPAVHPQHPGLGFAPAVQRQQPPSAPVSFNGGGNGGGDSGSGLPRHIEVRTNAAGRTYYVNHRTKVTSWVTPPREDW